MARQHGLLQMTGRVGDTVFYKNKRGFQVRTRGGITKERMMSDPAFQPVRDHIAEFKHAAHASKILRTILRVTTKVAKDGSMPNRMTTAMLRVLQADTSSPRGSRNVIDGDLTLLKGFEFNRQVRLPDILFTGYEATFDRPTGKATVDISPMIPSVNLIKPIQATHFRFGVAAAEIDLATVNTYDVMTYSNTLPIDHQNLAATTITATIKAASTLPVVVSFAIEFFDQTNGMDYVVPNKEFNACMIMIVSKP